MKGCRIISNEEISRIISSLSIRDKVLVLTGLNFGLRISESLPLTFGDVSGQYININSLKGSNNASFVIPQAYHQAISELKSYYTSKGLSVTDDTYLFQSKKGVNEHIKKRQANQIMKDTCEELGIEGKVNTHSFRKTFVTKIYELTKFNIAQTKVYSRHKNLANLDYYINTCQTTELINDLSWGV